MKYVLIIFLIHFISQSMSAELKGNDMNVDILKEIRVTYYSAVENDSKIDELENIIVNEFSNNINNYPPIILAYWGGVEALKAKHAFWPFTKLSLLNKSMGIFEKALMESPDNLEIRFLRFTILHYIPSILGYSEERNDDLRMISDLIIKNKTGSLNSEIQKGILEFMIESGRLDKYNESFFINKLAQYKNDE